MITRAQEEKKGGRESIQSFNLSEKKERQRERQVERGRERREGCGMRQRKRDGERGKRFRFRAFFSLIQLQEREKRKGIKRH